MENTILALKAGALPANQDGRCGLTLGGRTSLAVSAQETALLHALFQRAQPIADLKALLLAGDPSPVGEAFAALTLAEFIIRFGDYLEN